MEKSSPKRLADFRPLIIVGIEGPNLFCLVKYPKHIRNTIRLRIGFLIAEMITYGGVKTGKSLAAPIATSRRNRKGKLFLNALENLSRPRSASFGSIKTVYFIHSSLTEFKYIFEESAK